MARIPLPAPETMTADQRAVYEDIVAPPRKGLVGPLRAALHSPELADRWQKLGALLRYQTSLPPRLGELSIITTARRWNSQVEWHFHAIAARQAGLSDEIIEAIRFARAPEFEDSTEAAIYEYTREIQTFGHVSEKLYKKVLAALQPVGIVELTALMGYYTMVSMTLNAHEIPLPDGVEPPLEPVGPRHTDPSNSNNGIGLTTLLPARMKNGSPVLE